MNSMEWTNAPVVSYKPGWIQLVEDLRSLRLWRLEFYVIDEFDLDFGFDGDESPKEHLASRIMDYVLHGYGINPLLQNDKALMDWDVELWH